MTKRLMAALFATIGYAAAINAQTPAGPDSTELLFWESVRNSTNRADFEEYIRQYPNGKFAGLARNRLNAGAGGCDISGTWRGEIMSGGHSAWSTIELKVSGQQISGTRLPMTSGGKQFPAAPLTGEAKGDGVFTLMEPSTNQIAGPTVFNLFINDACSLLRGKWTVTIQGRNHEGIVGYQRQ